MKRLIEIGFFLVGNWTIQEGKINLNLESHHNDKRILYCFSSEGKIMYIGKTTQKLQTRLRGYQKPGPTQRTNIRVKQRILEHLSNNENISIFILPDNRRLKIGDFDLSISAGLEDSLIYQYKPVWNLTGTNSDSDLSPKKQLKARISFSKVCMNSEDILIENILIKLSQTYYNMGFFNIPIRYSNQFGKNNSEIIIHLLNNQNPIFGMIDRESNANSTPRIRGRKQLKEWIQTNFAEGEVLHVEIITPNEIRLSRWTKK